MTGASSRNDFNAFMAAFDKDRKAREKTNLANQYGIKCIMLVEAIHRSPPGTAGGIADADAGKNSPCVARTARKTVRLAVVVI